MTRGDVDIVALGPHFPNACLRATRAPYGDTNIMPSRDTLSDARIVKIYINALQLNRTKLHRPFYPGRIVGIILHIVWFDEGSNWLER